MSERVSIFPSVEVRLEQAEASLNKMGMIVHAAVCRDARSANARLRARCEALESALREEADVRDAWMKCWADLTRNVAPLIAAFREGGGEVTEEQADAALLTMAEMQRIEAMLGEKFFRLRDALAGGGAR